MRAKNWRQRSSNADLIRRRTIGIQIIKDHHYDLSEKRFREEYKERIFKELSDSVSVCTIRSDQKWIIGEIRKDTPTFSFAEKIHLKTSAKDTRTITPLASFEKTITEIHLVFSDGTSAIIFDTEQMQLGTDTFVSNAMQSVPDTLPDDSLVTLRIFFSPISYRGIETVVCDIYERSPEFTPFIIISSTARHRCADIEIKKEHIAPMLEFTYRLFNRYWTSHVNKLQKRKKTKQK